MRFCSEAHWGGCIVGWTHPRTYLYRAIRPCRACSPGMQCVVNIWRLPSRIPAHARPHRGAVSTGGPIHPGVLL